MASWTTPTTYITGNTLSVSAWNSVANNETFLYQHSYAMYYANGSQTISNESVTQIALNSSTASGYGFNLSGNNMVVPLTGTYWVSGGVAFNNNSGNYSSQIYHNGSAAAGNNSYQNSVSCGLSCSASDTIGLWVYQNSGSGAPIVVGAANTYLHAVFIGSS